MSNSLLVCVIENLAFLLGAYIVIRLFFWWEERN